VTTPPMPASQEEWAAHWAFYELTVAQRDRAWREIERLRPPVTAPADPPNPADGHQIHTDHAGTYRLTCQNRPFATITFGNLDDAFDLVAPWVIEQMDVHRRRCPLEAPRG
jgi:hypothetical protein